MNNAWVIDNSDDSDGIDLRAKYRVTPFTLQNVFADFLYTEGLKVKSGTVRRACMARLDMYWRDRIGQSSKAWHCDLEKGNVSKMNVLRIKYSASILSSDLNERATSIKINAESVFAANSKKKQPTVNDILSGDV
ncbi:hypothetical protein C2S52_001001 [Perilla frutescens var. hirtella]|nr:hypothetical protein C2S52_001001 [Perilla frutescens var. hirtella]